MTDPLDAVRRRDESAEPGPAAFLFDAEALRQWATRALSGSGVSRADATVTAEVLVRTSLRGIDTHGVSRLPDYLRKLATGEVDARARPRIETLHGLLRCDGDGGLGQVVGSFALAQAMAVARSSALVACRIHSTGHLGALGTLLLPAAEAGFFAMLCQRTPPIMAMRGATSAAIGNNPIAFAMPVRDGPPLVFDMAHSVVARGRVAQALRDGQDAIPSDWALGPDGEPTTDPAAALRGAMQPIAGHKGMGLAMLVECLAGSLNAALVETPAPAAEGAGGSASDVSAFLMVVNPSLAIGRDAFDASVASWMQRCRDASGGSARYPGERQATCEAARRAAGIPIGEALMRELHSAGRDCGQPFDPVPLGGALP